MGIVRRRWLPVMTEAWGGASYFEVWLQCVIPHDVGSLKGFYVHEIKTGDHGVFDSKAEAEEKGERLRQEIPLCPEHGVATRAAVSEGIYPVLDAP